MLHRAYRLFGAAAQNNVIDGNRIGVYQAGTSALPNGQYGVTLYSDNNTVGTAGVGNTVSADPPVWSMGPPPGNTTIRNPVGTDITGQQIIGNGGHGVYLVAPG